MGKKNVETCKKSIDFFIGLWYDTLSRIMMKGQMKKMDFNDIKTDELIEIYKKIDEFIKFLEKEKQESKKLEK